MPKKYGTRGRKIWGAKGRVRARTTPRNSERGVCGMDGLVSNTWDCLRLLGFGTRGVWVAEACVSLRGVSGAASEPGIGLNPRNTQGEKRQRYGVRDRARPRKPCIAHVQRGKRVEAC